MNYMVGTQLVEEWISISGDGFAHGWGCPKCGKIVWLDLGISPDDCDIHYCARCGQPLMEHGGTFKGWTK